MMYISKPLYYLLPIAIIYSVYKYRTKNILLLNTLILSAFSFCFYSFIVKTKLPTYLFYIVPFFMIYISILLVDIVELSRRKKNILFPIAAIFIAYLSYEHSYFKSYDGMSEDVKKAIIYNTEVYQKAKTYIPDSIKLVCNIPSLQDKDFMFFNNDKIAMRYWFPEEVVDSLRIAKTPIAAFQNRGGYELPDFLKTYPYLYIIPIELK